MITANIMSLAVANLSAYVRTMKSLPLSILIVPAMLMASGHRSTHGDSCALQLLAESRPALQALLSRTTSLDVSIEFYATVREETISGVLRARAVELLGRGSIHGNTGVPVVVLDDFASRDAIYGLLEALVAEGLVDSMWIGSREATGSLTRSQGRPQFVPKNALEDQIKLSDGTWVEIAGSSADTL